jgi:hypothetical protein
MANRLIIQPLKITNVRTGRESFVVKLCVGDGNTLDWIDFEEIPDDDIQILRELIQYNDEDIDDFIKLIKDHQDVTIGDKRYTWEQIKDVFDGDECVQWRFGVEEESD